MTGDPELRALAAAFPSWRIHQNTQDGAFIAWRPGVRPPFRFREATVAALRERLEWAAQVDEKRLTGGGTMMGQDPDDLAALRERFPGWEFEARWITAGTSSDQRRIFGRQGRVTVSGWTAEDVSDAIERHP